MDRKTCLITVALLLVGIVVGPSVAGAQPVPDPFAVKVHEYDDRASSWQCSSTPSGYTCSWLYALVDTDWATGNPFSYLQYGVYFYTPSWGYINQLSGYGPIPLSAFNTSGASGKASLSVDTSGLPGFTNRECDWYSCSPAPGGTVEADWTPNGNYTDRGTSQGSYEYSGQVTKYNYLYFTDSADCTGSILGHAVSGQNGYVQTWRQNYTTRDN